MPTLGTPIDANFLKGTELFQRQQGHDPESFPTYPPVVQGAVRRGEERLQDKVQHLPR